MPDLWIMTNPDNIPSIKSAEGAGFMFEDEIEIPEYHSLYKMGDRYNCRFKYEFR